MSRHVLVTGGTRGIGAAVAELALEAGDVVTVTAHGPLDAVVANAAQIGTIGPFLDSSLQQARRLLEVNVLGIVALAQAVARHWVAGARPGVIVTIGSVAAQSGAPGEYPVYAASKAAVDSLTRGLGRELAPHGIRVVCVAPGTTDTGMHATAGEPGRAARVAARLPFGRVAQPVEIARAVLWATSDDASYVTATTITVAGGQ